MISRIEENKIIWKQFIIESPWLTKPLSDKLTSDMEGLDVNQIKELKYLGNFEEFEIYEDESADNMTELYFIQNDVLLAYYKYLNRSSESIQTKMIWSSSKFKNAFLIIFGGYIVPRFQIVESDDMLTPLAFDFWKRLIGAYENLNYYAKIESGLVEMRNPYDVFSYEEKFKPKGNSTFIASVKPLIKN